MSVRAGARMSSASVFSSSQDSSRTAAGPNAAVEVTATASAPVIRTALSTWLREPTTGTPRMFSDERVAWPAAAELAVPPETQAPMTR